MKYVLMALFAAAFGMNVSAQEIFEKNGKIQGYINGDQDLFSLKGVVQDQDIYTSLKIVKFNAKVDGVGAPFNNNFLLGVSADMDLNIGLWNTITSTADTASAARSNLNGTHVEFDIQAGSAVYNKDGLMVGLLIQTGIYMPREVTTVEGGNADHMLGAAILFVSKTQVTTVAVKAHTAIGADYLKSVAYDLVGKSEITIGKSHENWLDAVLVEAGVYNIGANDRLALMAALKATFEFYAGEVDGDAAKGSSYFFIAPLINVIPNATSKVRTGLEVGWKLKM